MNATLAELMKSFNQLYNLPLRDSPGVHPDFPSGEEIADRIEKFQLTLMDELDEGDEICNMVRPFSVDTLKLEEAQLDVLTELADWLGDIIVYCMSEAAKFGIPIEAVIRIIMASNMSKLGEDGKPLYDARGKVLKGPSYWKPEPRIRELLLIHMQQAKSMATVGQSELPLDVKENHEYDPRN